MPSTHFICSFFAISIILNLPCVLLFSRNRQNSKFSRDFLDVTSSSNESDDGVIVITSGEEIGTGSQSHRSRNGVIINGRLLVREDGGELRQLLCPENALLRYDLKAGKCSEIDTQAHCGDKMIFKEELDSSSSSYGYCECDFENHEVPLVFHLPSNACYPIYSQGYCKPGDWLILSKEAKGPLCQRNQCLIPSRLPSRNERLESKRTFSWIWERSSRKSGHDPVIKIKDMDMIKSSTLPVITARLVPLNGTGPCILLGSGSKFCEVNEKVIIGQDDIVPRCGVPGKSLRRLSIIPNACPPGSYYSIIGYCQPAWDF